MTTDRRAALVALKDAVEAGEFLDLDPKSPRFNKFMRAAEPALDLGANPASAWRAYCFNDVNAALALLGAVLPGWGMGIIGPMSSGEYRATVLPRQDDPPEYHGNAPTPARALLLATLAALVEKEPQP